MVRITFSCEASLRDSLNKQADDEGIPRSQLIIEFLEMALTDTGEAEKRNPAINRLMFDVQERISNLEVWRKQIQEWTKTSTINTDNLEHTVGELLNQQLTEPEIEYKISKGEDIPAPRRKSS